MKQQVNYPPIGTIEVITRRGIHRTIYSVSMQGVRITTSIKNLKNVFPLPEERVNWIVETRAKLFVKYPNGGKIIPTDTISTTHWNMHFSASKEVKRGFAVKRDGDDIIVKYPIDSDFKKDETQVAIKRILRQLLYKEAKETLPNRLDVLAQNYNFNYCGLKINGATTRWGSCSSKKQINLSLYLLLLPLELIDFVIIHELCHTEQMNHGPKFKARMREIFVNYDTLNGKLKEEGKRLILYKL